MLQYKIINISTKWLQRKFVCSSDYIINSCKGRCCQGSGGKILISLLPEEEEYHRGKGFSVVNGLLNPQGYLCPYKLKSGLCGLHNTEFKPFGCRISPFTLSSKDTLIIRYRYSRLKCFGNGSPAYIVFKSSLELLFGKTETELIKEAIENNLEVIAKMPIKIYNDLKYLDGLK